MSISLSDIAASTCGPPRILLYGVPGIGKSTLAAAAPAAVVIPVEDGLTKIKVQTFNHAKLQRYEDVCDAVKALRDGEHEHQTCVIDAGDKLEPMLQNYVCRTVKTEKGATPANIHAYGFHKGFDHARDEWGRFLDLLTTLRDQRGMATILVLHSTVAHVDSPDAEPYDRYQPGIEKKSEPQLRGWADAVLFFNYEISTIAQDARRDDRRRAVGSGQRTLLTQERPAWYAKNRYGLPLSVQVASGNNIDEATAAAAAVWDNVLLPAMAPDAVPEEETAGEPSATPANV
jgi:shikimate kinase